MIVTKYYQGKKVLITGASSGIGLLMAQKIAQLGGKIINWDINPPKKISDDVNKAKYKSNDEYNSETNNFAFYQVDLSDKEQIYKTAQKTIQDQKNIDIIINNAGIVSGDYLQNLSDEKIDRTFAVNTLALFYISKAFFDILLKAKAPKIVTIASAAGIIATAKQSDYSASKFAAVGFMDAIRNEFKREKLPIRTLLVCPYYIDTGMFEGVKTRVPLLLSIMKPEYVAKRIVGTIPTKRQRLILPRFASIAPFVKSLPVCISDFIVNLFGLNESMDDFKGRKENNSK